MAVTLIVASRDLTRLAQNLQWTLVDPGGCETCTFDLAGTVTVPAPGDRVRVFEGLQCVWDGRVEEPGDDLDALQAPGHVTAVGAGAVLKDGRMSMVFLDRQLGGWQGPSRQRQINLLGASQAIQGDPEVTPDTSTGSPSLKVGWIGPWNNPAAVVEAWYDAGAPNLIGRVRGTWTRISGVTSADVNWWWRAALSSDDVATTTNDTGNLAALGPGTVDLASGGSRRFCRLDLFYAAVGAAGVDGTMYAVDWTNLRIFGDHGLTIRGGTPSTDGFYPDDIVRYVAGLVPSVALGVIGDGSSYTVLHSVYRDPVPHETPIDDMAKLLGWHWGVWPARSLVGPDTPVLDFRPPPSSATAVVARADCRGLKLVQRLSDFHDVAKVKYSDPAGTSGYATVTLANPRLPAGVSRTLDLDAGSTTAAVAAQVGAAALALEQQQSRAAGPCDLPPVVTAGSGRKLAHLLQPGIDRLKITGLPNAGAWTDPDTRRYDTFRIQRLTAAVGSNGAVKTSVDLDSGINLQDVLMARLQLEAGISGA